MSFCVSELKLKEFNFKVVVVCGADVRLFSNVRALEEDGTCLGTCSVDEMASVTTCNALGSLLPGPSIVTQRVAFGKCLLGSSRCWLRKSGVVIAGVAIANEQSVKNCIILCQLIGN